jgi:preprotein translocase subunit SecA
VKKATPEADAAASASAPQESARGAFGQRVDAPAAAPQNREQRRAAKKKR